MPVGILVHGRRRPRPGARPRARAVALDWGIFSQRFRGEFTQQLQLRDELLDREIFCTLHEAKVLIERWRRHYNTVRPHSALGYRPPAPQTILPRPAGPAYAPLRHAQPGAPWHGPPLS